MAKEILKGQLQINREILIDHEMYYYDENINNTLKLEVFMVTFKFSNHTSILPNSVLVTALLESIDQRL